MSIECEPPGGFSRQPASQPANKKLRIETESQFLNWDWVSVSWKNDILSIGGDILSDESDNGAATIETESQ